MQGLIRSHGLQAVTGRELDGESVTPAVLERVESSDALVALMTRRDEITEEGEIFWRTHPWVRDEINHARGQKMPSIALVEDGVKLEGAYGDNEWIALHRNDPLAAFMGLSQRIANWRRLIGQSVVARLEPGELGHEISDEENTVCEYRLWSDDGEPGDWTPGFVIPAEGGTQLFIKGVPGDRALIEVRVRTFDTVTWQSKATSQHMRIELAQKEV